jgi:hypothetical protein
MSAYSSKCVTKNWIVLCCFWYRATLLALKLKQLSSQCFTKYSPTLVVDCTVRLRHFYSLHGERVGVCVCASTDFNLRTEGCILMNSDKKLQEHFDFYKDKHLCTYFVRL